MYCTIIFEIIIIKRIAFFTWNRHAVSPLSAIVVVVVFLVSSNDYAKYPNYEVDVVDKWLAHASV